MKLRISTLALLIASACTDELDTPDTPRSEIASPLAGAWFTGTLSTFQYYDPVTGEWDDPSGEGFYYLIDESGDYETGAVINSTVAGCTARLLGTERGTLTLDGADAIIEHRHWIKVSVSSTCGDDGERTQGPATARVRWAIGRDAAGNETLSLENPDGSVESYYRWQDFELRGEDVQ